MSDKGQLAIALDLDGDDVDAVELLMSHGGGVVPEQAEGEIVGRRDWRFVWAQAEIARR